MKYQILNFSHSGICLSFQILENNTINFIFAGKEEYLSDKNACEHNFSKVVEVEYVDGKGNSHRGLKHFDSSYGKTCKYVCHTFLENKRGKELIIVTSNDILEVKTHYQFYNNISAISSYNEVKNISSNVITLEYVSSYFQHGICPANQKNNYLYKATNSWHCEAQWNKFNFLDLGIFNGNENTSMKRFSINNTGGWSTKEHLPMVGLELENGFTLLQLENNGSWHIEVGDYANNVYLAASGPEYFDNQWMKKIVPNEIFVSCQATITYGKDFEESIQEMTRVRRILRRPSLDDEELPVIFNDYMHALWDTQTTELILPLVDAAKELNCEEFCMDAGWFENGSQWWNVLGKWEEYAPNFPNGGLKAVVDYIKSKGMKAGLWIEIEAVGVKSPILQTMKDGWLFKVGGVDIDNNERYQLNFANPEVYEYAIKVVDRLMALYNLDYIKIDYNVDAGIGNEYNSDSLGDGLLKHNRAYIKWLNEIMDKYPLLTIENCASGGCRMDYETLKYCPIQSTSDQTNYRKYPYLSANVLTACPPEQAAVWSYPINDYEKIMPTDEVVIMNMCNAMLGRIHLASFVNKLPENQKELIREGIKFYHSISEMKKHSVPFYPNGTSKFFDDQVIGGIMDEKEGVLGVWNTSGKPTTIKVNLSKYNFNDVFIGYPLLNETEYSYNKNTQTLSVTFKEDYGGRIFKIIR